MGTKLDPRDASAYEAMDRLLFREWDPVGVSAMSGPEGEYRSYLPGFWALVIADASETDIAGYLETIEREWMQVATSEAHRLNIAAKALALVAAWRMPVRK